jgi:hemerythrin-like domain-containing protein
MHDGTEVPIMDCQHERRRVFLIAAGAAGASTLLAACASATATPSSAPGQKEAEEVSPVEDLMREHGVLRRLLLIYEEVTRRIENQEPFPLEVLTSAAGLIRRFVEDYHEKLEEDFVFPRFEKANKLIDLVTVLRQQHQAGRRVTDTIQALAKPAGLQSAEVRPKLSAALQAFGRMYRPHSAREDTVLFPALRPLVGAKEYDALGEVFEDKEHALFGPRGFEGVVAEVAQLEQALGIYDLAKFTPP